MAEDPAPRYESFIDRLVREATERGEFDHLPGKGQPLHLKWVGDPDWCSSRFALVNNFVGLGSSSKLGCARPSSLWIKEKLERENLTGGELRRQFKDRGRDSRPS
ncbi:DnaJ family domain-containing protein [Propionimicrobium sp. PCR01-08-3]|uniref:DnaJ family domain-containing protein n=1 Tax=Propionimicrobium sp. PCR01-08-3 TaxID=3052086 RepID=UPI00255C2912|nr:DnaJ family domain-containing protein [Propionimicrobium sp. PCR01-08-3]WIY83299.1 DUF1992 domain-containing protein [Propionimicrobium sp. PCR01-08-3]